MLQSSALLSASRKVLGSRSFVLSGGFSLRVPVLRGACKDFGQKVTICYQVHHYIVTRDSTLVNIRYELYQYHQRGSGGTLETCNQLFFAVSSILEAVYCYGYKFVLYNSQLYMPGIRGGGKN